MFFLLSVRAKKPEIPGVNKIWTSCFKIQIFMFKISKSGEKSFFVHFIFWEREQEIYVWKIFAKRLELFVHVVLFEAIFDLLET